MSSIIAELQTIMLAVLAFIVASISVLLIRLIGKDAETFLPRLAVRIVGRAAKRLPKEIREECLEEWSAGLEETPEILGKVVFAVKAYYLIAPRTIREFDWVKTQAIVNRLVGATNDDRDPKEKLTVQIAALESRRMHLQKWFKSANSHEIRRLGTERSMEVEQIDKELAQFKALL